MDEEKILNAEASHYLDEAAFASSLVSKKEREKGEVKDPSHMYPRSKGEADQMVALLKQAEAVADDAKEASFAERYATLRGIADWSLKRHKTWQWTLVVAALVGAAWNGHSADFSKTYSVQLMYKRYFKSYETTRGYHSFQLTGVWGLNFAKGKGTFSGFIDLWRGEKANGHGQLVVLTEPQLWYNVTSHLSFGSEIEVSNCFIYNTYNDKTFFVNPTLGAKWNF